jgi:hypothetical protein
MSGMVLSLADEPFAGAMASLGDVSVQRRAMIGERLIAISQAKRDELRDPHQGDGELEWWSGDEPPVLLALGYDGHEPSFDLRDEDDKVIVAWDGDVARALLSLGQRGRAQLNVMPDEVPAVLEEARYGVLW